MEVLAWIIAVVLGFAAIVLLVLWLRAHIALQAAKDTLADVQNALKASPSTAKAQGSKAQGVKNQGITVFADNEIFKVLAKGEINIDGTIHSFGVVLPDSGTASPFLVAKRMKHISGGDYFSACGKQLYKVELGSPSPSASPVTTSHWTSMAEQTSAPTIKAPSHGADDDVENRTVIFAPTRSNPEEDPVAGLPYLHVIQGPDSGTKFHLPFTHATIGRDPANIIPLRENGSSRLHCEIFYRGHAFILKDAKSTNGTSCNGVNIDTHELEFGDQIKVANTLMTFTADGHELLNSDVNSAIDAFKTCLTKEPDFLLALKNLAFLLERDLERKDEAKPLWRKIAQLEQQR